LWILHRTVGTKHVAVARLGAQDSSSGTKKGRNGIEQLGLDI
jgi:hypothetical protein